jgi:hypothetical protein
LAVQPDFEEDDMPRAKELKIRTDDRPGLLGEIASALGEKKINIRGVNAWIEDGQAVVRLVVDKGPAAKKTLAARGWTAVEQDVLEIELADKPGTLGRAAQALGAAGINILHVYAGAGGPRKATIFLGVPDLKAAMKAVR